MLWALVLVWVGATTAHGQDAAPRKVAVSEFAGQGGKELRLALLEVLSEQDDLEVLGHRDIEIVAKRLGVGLGAPSDRRKVGAELKIFAWFDGELDGEGASVRVSNREGRELGVMRLQGSSVDERAAEVREGVWTALGHHVSDRALRLHVLGQHRAAAARKLEARTAELQRQRQLAAEREARRAEALAQLRQEAARKLQNRDEEQARQVAVAHKRIAAENERKERELAAQREAEAARQRQAALERQRAEAAMAAKPVAPKPVGAPSPRFGQQPAAAASAPGSPAPSGRFGDRSWVQDASPATQQWMQRQQAPAPAPAPAAPAAGGDGTECPPTISEATCKWLQSRGGAR